MAALTDDTPATDLWVLRPMLRRHRTSVDRHNKTLRRLDTVKQDLHLVHLGSKTTIEAHHQKRHGTLCTHSLVGFDDLCQLLRGECQGFFDKDMLAGLQSAADQLRMTVVTCGNHQDIDRF